MGTGSFIRRSYASWAATFGQKKHNYVFKRSMVTFNQVWRWFVEVRKTAEFVSFQQVNGGQIKDRQICPKRTGVSICTYKHTFRASTKIQLFTVYAVEPATKSLRFGALVHICAQAFVVVVESFRIFRLLEKSGQMKMKKTTYFSYTCSKAALSI